MWIQNLVLGVCIYTSMRPRQSLGGLWNPARKNHEKSPSCQPNLIQPKPKPNAHRKPNNHLGKKPCSLNPVPFVPRSRPGQSRFPPPRRGSGNERHWGFLPLTLSPPAHPITQASLHRDSKQVNLLARGKRPCPNWRIHFVSPLSRAKTKLLPPSSPASRRA